MTTKPVRKVYFISDGTGITAEALGQSLLSQFESFQFETQTLPYINDTEKATKVIQTISNDPCKLKPLVFSTLVNEEIRDLFLKAPFLTLDLFNSFTSPLETELQEKSTHTMGLAHGVSFKNYNNYMLRMNAVNYALSNDDGANINDYRQADVILLGVSRCGKTPTCLYLALQFGIYAANYPLTEDEENLQALPMLLKPLKEKIFGLTIEPSRLQQIRNERRPGSKYAAMQTCRFEVKEVESMFKKERIPFLNTTTRSIEELATEIMVSTGLKRRLN